MNKDIEIALGELKLFFKFDTEPTWGTRIDYPVPGDPAYDLRNIVINEAKSLIAYAESDGDNDFPTVMNLTQRENRIISEISNDGVLRNEYMKFSRSIEKLRLAIEDATK